MKLHRGRTLEHWCRERRGLLGAESGNDILGGREQHVQRQRHEPAWHTLQLCILL